MRKPLSFRYCRVERRFCSRHTGRVCSAPADYTGHMCIQEGLHQVDLLSPAETKITQAEYMAQKSGQKKLEETNKKIIADGLKPTATTFQTQKQELRNAIEECSSHSKNFQESQSLLLEKYQISVIEERGRYRYLHPDRDKRITEKALGTQYGNDFFICLF